MVVAVEAVAVALWLEDAVLLVVPALALVLLELADVLLADVLLAEALLVLDAELLADDEPPPQAARPSIATRAALAAIARSFVFEFFMLLPFGCCLPLRPRGRLQPF